MKNGCFTLSDGGASGGGRDVGLGDGWDGDEAGQSDEEAASERH
jgi:hypothetical protein